MPIKTETTEKISKTKARNAAIAAQHERRCRRSPRPSLTSWCPGPMSPAEFNNLSMALKKALVERVLGAELTHHLGYAPGAERPEDAGNHRNGASAKTVRTDDGPLRIEVPRDRRLFEPLLIRKHERRFTGFDDKIIAMYARGMTVREIQGFWPSVRRRGEPEFISAVTDAVMAEVGAWQARPLEPMYPVVFFDALRVKIREEAVSKRGVYLAMGAMPDGTRDCWACGSGQRGCEVLDGGVDGVEEARLARRLYRLYRRLERLSGGLTACSLQPRCRPASCT